MAQLNELLKSTLNIADAPVMAMSAAAPAAPVEVSTHNYIFQGLFFSQNSNKLIKLRLIKE